MYQSADQSNKAKKLLLPPPIAAPDGLLPQIHPLPSDEGRNNGVDRGGS